MESGSSGAASSRLGKVRVTRSAGYRDLLRTYELYADGHRVGKVRAGQSVEVTLPVGRCSMEARIDWCRSKPVEVDVLEQGCAELTVATGNLLAIIPPARGYVRLWEGAHSPGRALAIVRLLLGTAVLLGVVVVGFSGARPQSAELGWPYSLLVPVGVVAVVAIVGGIVRLLPVRSAQSKV